MIHCTTKKTVLDGKPVLLDFGLDAYANLDVELELIPEDNSATKAEKKPAPADNAQPPDANGK